MAIYARLIGTEQPRPGIQGDNGLLKVTQATSLHAAPLNVGAVRDLSDARRSGISLSAPHAAHHARMSSAEGVVLVCSIREDLDSCHPADRAIARSLRPLISRSCCASVSLAWRTLDVVAVEAEHLRAFGQPDPRVLPYLQRAGDRGHGKDPEPAAPGLVSEKFPLVAGNAGPVQPPQFRVHPLDVAGGSDQVGQLGLGGAVKAPQFKVSLGRHRRAVLDLGDLGVMPPRASGELSCSETSVGA